jgi:hypothetical protein
MLHSIQLENFKAFGRRSIIPFAPITLIFGENSAGKSSILHSLNLLKQTRESRDVEALLLPRTENGFVDLGSFQDLLFDHDLDHELSIRINVAPSRRTPTPAYRPRLFRNARLLGLEVTFSRKTKKEEITLEGFKLCGEDQSSHVASFDKAQMPQRFRRSLPFSPRAERRRQTGSLRATRCSSIRHEPDFWKPAFDWSSQSRDQILAILEESRKHFERRSSQGVLSAEFDEGSDEARRQFSDKLTEAIQFFSNEFELSQYIDWMIRDQADMYVALDGFIPIYAGRDTDLPTLETLLSPPFGRVASRRELIPDVGFASIYAGRMVEETLASLFPLGPYRKPPSRWYIFTGTTPQDVGYQGHLLPDLLFRQPDLLAEANKWLKSLDVGYSITIRSLGDASSDLFELRLLDERREPSIEVGLSDVGFGISQILPLIVQSLAATDQIITIEQPEVHIHPRLQADLGDLLCEAIREPRRNQFIVETHSEHLALRLQRRVRDKTLTPSDLSVLYVSRSPEGATVTSLRLDEEGDFIDDFPGGFFPERLRELR